MKTRIATLIVLLASIAAVLVWVGGDPGPEDPGPEETSSASVHTDRSVSPPSQKEPPSPASQANPQVGESKPGESTPTRTAAESEVLQLSGTVIDANTRAPVASTTVRLSESSPDFTVRRVRTESVSSSTPVTSEPTTAGGVFHLACPAPASGHVIGFLDVPDPYLRPTEAVLVQLEQHDRAAILPVVAAGVIEGTITHQAGTPAASIAVALRPAQTFAQLSRDPARARGAKTQTDAQGRFRFEGVPANAPLLLEAQPKNRPYKATEITAIAGQDRSVTVVLDQGHSIRGQALDLAARPVPGMTVTVRRGEVSLSGAERGELDTNPRPATILEEGRFVAEGLAAGRYDVSVRAEGYAPTVKTGIRVGPNDAVLDAPLLLKQGLLIRGRIVDDRGDPVAGADIGFVPPRRIMGFDISSTTGARKAEELGGSLTVSDEAGSFVSPSLKPGSYDVIGDAKGYSRGRATSVTTGTTDVEITVARQASIHGVAISLEEGEPIPRFQVGVTHAVSLMDPSTLIPGPSRDIVSRNGTFVLEGIEPGTWSLRVHASGHAPFELPDLILGAGEQKRGVIALLPPESRIEGQVIDASSGTPIAGTQISTRHGLDMILPNPMLRMSDATSDSEGRFVMKGLGAGSFQLTGTADDYAPGTSRRITTANGEVIEDVTIRLAPGAVLRGIVYDSDDKPASGALIQAILLGSMTPAMDTTKDDGAYEVRGLAAGRYTVNKIGGTFSTGAENMMSELTAGLETKTIDIKAGEVVTLDFKADQGGVTLGGRVSEAGDPVPQAILSIQPLDTGEIAAGLKIAIADADGRYEAKGLVPGEWTITLQTSANMTSVSKQSFDIEIPNQPHVQRNFEIDVTGVQGQVLSAEFRTPLPNVRVAVSALDEGATVDAIARAAGSTRVADVFTGADGMYRAGGLPPGRYKVVAGGPGMFGLGGGAQISEPRIVEIQEDELLRDVNFRLEPGAALVGSVLDPDGQPVPGAALFFLPGIGEIDPHFGEIVSDEAGSYRADGLKPGSYSIAAKGTGFAPTVVRSVMATRGEVTERDITLKTGGRIVVEVPGGIIIPPSAVKVFDASGLDLTSFVSVADAFAAMGAAATAGSLDLGPISPGTYTLVVQLGGDVLQQEIHHGTQDETVTLTLGG